MWSDCNSFNNNYFADHFARDFWKVVFAYFGAEFAPNHVLVMCFFSLSSKAPICASPSLLGEASNLEFAVSIISTKIDSVTDYLVLQCGHLVLSLINTGTVTKESTLQFMFNQKSRKQCVWKALNRTFG